MKTAVLLTSTFIRSNNNEAQVYILLLFILVTFCEAASANVSLISPLTQNRIESEHNDDTANLSPRHIHTERNSQIQL